jgi:hypothetical protein
MTVLELTVSLFLLTTAILAIVQLLSATAGQRRTLEKRRMAHQAVANQAERIARMPWEQTAPDKLTEWEAPAELLAVLPGAKCTAQVSEESGTPKARRIRLCVSWTDSVGQTVEPTAVTIWKFANGEGQ